VIGETLGVHDAIALEPVGKRKMDYQGGEIVEEEREERGGDKSGKRSKTTKEYPVPLQCHPRTRLKEC